MIKIMQMDMRNVLMRLQRPVVMIAMQSAQVAQAHHIALHKPTFTHRLHPRGLELSKAGIWMYAMY
jgi:hypothetical protein